MTESTTSAARSTANLRRADRTASALPQIPYVVFETAFMEVSHMVGDQLLFGAMAVLVREMVAVGHSAIRAAEQADGAAMPIGECLYNNGA